eukprot:COSAG03_NODE_21540_length_303_cov_0.421569_1_plen_36_part_01
MISKAQTVFVFVFVAAANSGGWVGRRADRQTDRQTK